MIPDLGAIADQRRILRVPASDTVRLADGRVLRFFTTTPVAPGVLAKVYKGPQGLSVIVGSESHPVHGRLLHVSLSYPNRLPDWDTVHNVRDALYPSDVDVMMILPRAEDYVNLHQYCLHLWQCPGVWGLR